jgi:hypothetical protein
MSYLQSLIDPVTVLFMFMLLLICVVSWNLLE